MAATTSAAVIVPVKAFGAAKVRLAGTLDPGERAALARHMAEIVLLAAAPLPVVVVCDDDEVRAWAERSGARVVWCPGRGLNGAVADGVAALAAGGVGRAVVAHADLPLATRLDWVADFDSVTLVPDRRLDGSNVVGVPTGAGFAFSYGAGSFGRHRAEAARLGLTVRIVRDAALAWDVDLPADLAFPGAAGVLAGDRALDGPAGGRAAPEAAGPRAEPVAQRSC
ncbi:MAG TPA: 2-phospho-L-lactate guanylyltransferase [Acidimicrobiales bacterium]|nr:2-phospho-L-lactate guanylyltransferase [Acidimicrobiales bacterium]